MVAYCLSQIICVVFDHARKYTSLYKYIGLTSISQRRDGIFSTYQIDYSDSYWGRAVIINETGLEYISAKGLYN